MLKVMSRDQTLTERARLQLEEHIIAGEMRPGDRLPSENEMGAMLGVSRTVVREAIRLLVATGLVEVRTGSGIYVRQLDSGVMRDPLDLLLRSRQLTIDEIIEVREAIEVRIAGLAAERAERADIEAMEEAIRLLRRTRNSPQEYAETDVLFHARLAAAARNPLFIVLSSSLNATMVGPIAQCARARGETAIEEAELDHARILDRVKAKDAEGARRAMQESLDQTRVIWQECNVEGAGAR
jgi:GntR family transcriptional regulator, transcriptional repressor for pyruvate dehydrogenase complex